MKKSLVGLFCLFMITLNVRASSNWELSEINLSERFSLNYFVEKKDNYLIAEGEEYDCEKGKCNLYKVELDGKISKLNDLISYSDEETSESILEIQNGLLVQTKEKCVADKCNVSASATIGEDVEYTYLNCPVDVYFDDELGHICEIGFIENGTTTKYGIINTNEEYIVEPSEEYQPIDKDEDFNQSIAILKNKDNNYIVVSENKKAEILLSSIVGSRNISYVRLAGVTENENYYAFDLDDVPLKDGEFRATVMNYDEFFTRNKNIEIEENGMILNSDMELLLINELPYFLVGPDYVQTGCQQSSLYTIDSKKIFANTCPFGFFDDKYIYFANDGKINIFDGEELVYEKEWSDYNNFLGNDFYDMENKTYYFTNSFNTTLSPESETFKIYVLKNISSKTENPDDSGNNTTENPKNYSCEIKDGKYYSKDGSEVDKKTYESVCGLTENPHTGIAIPIVGLIIIVIMGILIKQKQKKNFLSKI